MSIGDTCSFLQITSPSNGIFVTLFVTLKLKKALQISVAPFSAESEGFEPPDPLRSTVFKTAAFDHSANSPICSPIWDLSTSRTFPFPKGLQRYELFRNLQIILQFFPLLLQKTCNGRAKDRLLLLLRSCLQS